MCVLVKLCDYSQCSGLNKLERDLADCISELTEEIYSFLIVTQRNVFNFAYCMNSDCWRENEVKRGLYVLMKPQAIYK